jgi:HrpA-like RNA helicase
VTQFRYRGPQNFDRSHQQPNPIYTSERQGRPMPGFRARSIGGFAVQTAELPVDDLEAELLHDTLEAYEDELAADETEERLKNDTGWSAELPSATEGTAVSPEKPKDTIDTLPIDPFEDEICDAAMNNRVTILVANTGGGKSTRVPQMMLRAGFERVYETQPRRAAARNVHMRILEEAGINYGKEAASAMVSYRTAGEREGPEDAQIVLATDGLQLAKELHGNGSRDNEVLIIDESHEANANIDLLMGVVKKLLSEKPNLKVIIMSATMNAESVAEFFAVDGEPEPPILRIPGRTFPIESSEEPESTVLKEILKEAISLSASLKNATGETDEKVANGILAFMPGVREIKDTIDAVRDKLPPEIAETAHILPFHADLSVEEQQAAINSYSTGIKIIVATNIAQTSLTIPDVVTVIDSGYERRVELDEEGVQSLVLHPISRADADQRMGRTGRVGPGKYKLTKMDEKSGFVPYDMRELYPTPEILRTDIVRHTLRIAAIGWDMSTLELPHPVSQRSIEQALATLKVLGALDEGGTVTSVGKRMNDFPVRVQLARMLVEADRYSGLTRSYMNAIAASAEVGCLQDFSYDAGKQWQELTDETSSDMLVQLDLFIASQGMTPLELAEHDLHVRRTHKAKEVYAKLSRRNHKTVNTLLLSPKPEEREDLRKCIIAGLVDSIYVLDGDQKYVSADGTSKKRREISNRSAVKGSFSAVVGDPYNVQLPGRYDENGEREIKHVLERVTATSLAEIGRIATGLTDWVPAGYVLKNGVYKMVHEQTILGRSLGMSLTTVAEPSPKLREIIIQHTQERPGPQLKKLRELKGELERLAHLTTDHVPQLTHDTIIGLLEDAAPPDITDPTIIDHRLRQIIAERQITLDAIVSPERQARIIANAPSTYVVDDDVTLSVSYNQGNPTARHLRKADFPIIAELKDEVFLPDGRQVYFQYGHKRVTLVTLQGILAAEAEAEAAKRAASKARAAARAANKALAVS